MTKKVLVIDTAINLVIIVDKRTDAEGEPPMTSVIYEEMGQRIRSLRKQLRLTQDELARRVTLTRTSITNIENGNQTVSVHLLYELSNALGTNPIALLPDPSDLLRSDGVVRDPVFPTGDLSTEELSWVRKIRRSANEDGQS